MNADLQSAKQGLRGQVLTLLKSLTEARRTAASAQARTLLAAQPCWREAGSVLFYAPLSGELDVWPLVEEALALGKTLALPRFVPQTGAYVACQIQAPQEDLVIGKYGIREPASHCAHLVLNRLDLVLVPGVAFDLHGRRLGRGKGYYDQLLAGMRAEKCGVGFDEQIVPEVPVGSHDIDMNWILTPTRWVGL